jgi:hypothetical protein
LPGFSLAADHLSDALQLLRHSLVGGDDLVEDVGDLAFDAQMIAGHPHREVACAHRLQRVQKILQRVGLSVGLRLGGLRFGFRAAANG